MEADDYLDLSSDSMTAFLCKKNHGVQQGYNINTQKPITFLHTNDKHVETKINNTGPFTIASKKMKDLHRDLTKHILDMTRKLQNADEINNQRRPKYVDKRKQERPK